LGVAGWNSAFGYSENRVPPGPDEMFETITPTRRGNTLDPEVRNPALKGRGGVITRFKEAEAVASSEEVRGVIAGVRRDVEKLAGRISSLLSGRVSV